MGLGLAVFVVSDAMDRFALTALYMVRLDDALKTACTSGLM